MASPSELGRKSEEHMRTILVNAGYKILDIGTSYSAYDVLAEKNGKIFAINVKSGKNVYHVSRRNLERLIELTEKNWIPVLLFTIGDIYLFFPLEKIGWEYKGIRVDDDALIYEKAPEQPLVL